MIWLRVEGIGVAGPGINDCHELRSIVLGSAPYERRATRLEAPEILNPRERRRASPTVRLALAAAWEAVASSGTPPNTLSMVFGSSLGDGTVLNSLLETLADPARHVSPTLFHNSVHNSALAYWSIGTQTRLAGTSLAAHDFTVGAALLKSTAQISLDGGAVLLVVYDHPFPEPLSSTRPLLAAFSAALVLSLGREPSGPRIRVSLPQPVRKDPTPPRTKALEDLWLGNPAARVLPLLEALLLKRSTAIEVGFRSKGCLRVEVLS